MNKAFLETIQRLNFAPISATARIVMTDLLCHATPKRPLVTIDFDALVLRSGKSVHAIKRAIAQLVREGLLSWDGTVVRLKERVYTVVFENVERVVHAVSKVVSAVKSKVKERKTSVPLPELPAKEVVQAPPQPRDYISISREAQAKLDAYPPGEMRDIIMQLRAASVSYTYIVELIETLPMEKCRALALGYLEGITKEELLPAEAWIRQQLSWV